MKQPVAIDHFQHFRAPSHLKVSPGGQAAFLIKQASVEDNQYYSDLYLLRDG